MSEARTTTDHRLIKDWTEERGGSPATVKATADDEPGILRIDFPGYSGEESLDPIPWDDFFEKFDKENLAFLYQNRTEDGQVSRFCKFVSQQEACS